MTGTCELDPNGYELVVRFSYDKMLVEEIKTDLPRRRWDPGAKAWRIPAKDVERVYELLAKHGFEFGPEIPSLLAGTLPIPEPPKEEKKPKREKKEDDKPKAPEIREAILDEDGTNAFLRFPYDEGMVAAVKELPERRWDKKNRHWKVPVGCEGLRTFLAEHEFQLGDGLDEVLPAADESHTTPDTNEAAEE